MTPIEELSPFNFLSVCDVAFDIKEKLQMTEEDVVWIPIVRDVIRWQLLYPADGINHRDNYGDARNRGVRYLKSNGYILDFRLVHGDHRWMTRIKVDVDRKTFDNFYQQLNKVYDKRIVEPNKTEEQRKAEQELEKLKTIELELKERRDNPEKYEKIRKETAEKHKKELDEIYTSLDYASQAERKAWEKKWNVLQVLWSAYISANRLNKIALPQEKLTTNIGLSEVELSDILNGLQEKEGCIGHWYQKYGNYFFILYTYNDLLKTSYEKTNEVYKRYAISYEKRKADIKETNVQSASNVLYNYNSIGRASGELNIKNFKPLSFDKDRARILYFFYIAKGINCDYKNYNDFNKFANREISSDDFSKSIEAINKRVAKESNGLVQGLIEKKDSNQKNKANLYKWSDGFL